MSLGSLDALVEKRNLDILDRSRPDVVLILSGDHVYRADYRRFIEAHVERDADATVIPDSAAETKGGQSADPKRSTDAEQRPPDATLH